MHRSTRTQRNGIERVEMGSFILAIDGIGGHYSHGISASGVLA